MLKLLQYKTFWKKCICICICMPGNNECRDIGAKGPSESINTELKSRINEQFAEDEVALLEVSVFTFYQNFYINN